jgi:hypothetical protein
MPSASGPLPQGVTTLAIYGIPHNFTQHDLLAAWPPDGSYDFLHLPFSIRQRRTMGFAIVNFVSHQHVEDFRIRWAGQVLASALGPEEVLPRRPSKRLTIIVAKAQGLLMNIRHLQSSGITRMTQERHLPYVLRVVPGQPLERMDFLELLDSLPPDERVEDGLQDEVAAASHDAPSLHTAVGESFGDSHFLPPVVEYEDGLVL